MFGETPLVMIESTDALAQAVTSLRESPVLGVDTESDSFHHYQEKVCLLQVSDLSRDYIIDPLKVRDLSPLAPLMEDRSIVKIFHGADYDVVSLKRDFGFRFANLFDTMIAAQFLHLPRIGLADLIGRWFGHVIDKKYQRHDWAERPLLTEHLEYARGDTHFLPSLREILTRRLEAAGRLGPVLEECRIMEGREWAGRVHDPSDFLRVKGSATLSEAEKRVLRALYAYRDSEARGMDRPAFKVIPEPVLLELAKAQPKSFDEVTAMMRKGSGLARRYGTGIAAAVVEGLADESALPTGPAREPREKGPADVLRTRDQERLMGLLKDWRNRLVSRNNAAPVTVAANGLLREVVRYAPRSVEELARVPDIRQWQLEAHGDAIVDIVRSVAGETEATDADAATAEELPDGGAPAGKRRRRRGGGRKRGPGVSSEAGP
jgi:ribonuclease D